MSRYGGPFEVQHICGQICQGLQIVNILMFLSQSFYGIVYSGDIRCRGNFGIVMWC